MSRPCCRLCNTCVLVTCIVESGCMGLGDGVAAGPYETQPFLFSSIGCVVVLWCVPQVAEVEVLKTITQPELAAFAEEVLGAQSPARRKVTVLIRGSREFAGQQQQAGICPADAAPAAAIGNAGEGVDAAAEKAGTCSAADAEASTAATCSSSSGKDDVVYVSTAVPAGEQFLLIRDVSAFKRGCEVWPAAGQQHSKQLQQQHRRQSVLSGQGTAAAAPEGAGEAAAAAQSEDGVPGAAKL